MGRTLGQLWRKLSSRERRFVFYLAILLAFAAWRFAPRYWNPAITLETEHYIIASSATQVQTEEIGRAVELLYAAYAEQLSGLPGFQTNHPKLKLLLYKDREEFRRVNPGMGWAEAYYRKPYCRAYFSAQEENPYHWMIHEAVHQLNKEVARLRLKKWFEEGLAAYFSTSRIEKHQLLPGSIDQNTYPIWWIDEIATEPELEKNLENGSVIPLRAIITGRGGPRMRAHVNLYYLHWWSLAHFILETEKHRENALSLLISGGDLKSFEQLIGPIQTMQAEWHDHLQRIKTEIRGGPPLSTGRCACECSR